MDKSWTDVAIVLFPWIGGGAAIVFLILLFGTRLLQSEPGSSRWHDRVWLSWLAMVIYLLHVRCRLLQVQKRRNPRRCRDDGGRLREDEYGPPLRPDPGEPHPEESVGCGEAQARAARAFQDLQLVSECENLEVQRRAGVNQRTQRQEDGHEDGHHRSKAIRLCPKPQ